MARDFITEMEEKEMKRGGEKMKGRAEIIIIDGPNPMPWPIPIPWPRDCQSKSER